MSDDIDTLRCMDTIRKIRKAKGLSLQQVAESAGTTKAQIQKLETGQRRLTTDWITRIADALDCDPLDLMADLGTGDILTVRGQVQAGNFCEAAEWDRSKWYHVKVPISEQWEPFPKFGLEVRGPSMNRRYPENTILVCVRILDADIEPEPGHRYIVQTERAGEYETTVKELRIDNENRAWLWPDSDHPEHSTPLQINDDDNTDITVEIIAIVIASYQPE